ncbi:MAG: ROK family protein [Campylobacterota bacterium]|nr:ROK family protein [Campylobacterota bacterium]
MNLYIDFGGTNFRYQINNNKLKTLKSTEINLKNFLDHIILKHKIKNISISFAGHINNGSIISSPNIDIEPINLKKYLLKNYGVKLKIDNDLNCAALAEYKAIKQKNMAVFYIGTGFGASFINNGKILKGANNLSGEIGHIPYKKTPFRCGCGRDDCLELSVSGSGLIRWCNHYDIPMKYARVDELEKLNTKNGNIILKNFYGGLSYAFHTSLNLFDYDHLVLGGGVGANKYIKKYLKEQFKSSSFNKSSLNITISTIKDGSLEGTKFL